MILGDEVGDQTPRHRLAPGAHRRLQGEVAVGDPSVGIDQRDADRRIVEQPVEALFRRPQGAFPLLLGHHIAHDHRAGEDLAALVEHGVRHQGLEDLAATPL